LSVEVRRPVGFGDGGGLDEPVSDQSWRIETNGINKMQDGDRYGEDRHAPGHRCPDSPRPLPQPGPNGRHGTNVDHLSGAGSIWNWARATLSALFASTATSSPLSRCGCWPWSPPSNASKGAFACGSQPRSVASCYLWENEGPKSPYALSRKTRNAEFFRFTRGVRHTESRVGPVVRKAGLHCEKIERTALLHAGAAIDGPEDSLAAVANNIIEGLGHLFAKADVTRLLEVRHA
jgi:hypothetical protein